MRTKPYIIVADKDEGWRQILHGLLDNDFDVSDATNQIEAENAINNTGRPFDLLITEFNLDEGEQDEAGFHLIEHLENKKIDTQVIIFTQNDNKFSITKLRILQNWRRVNFQFKNDFNRDDFLKIVRDAIQKTYSGVYVFMAFSPSSYTRFYENHIKRIVEGLLLRCERADHTFDHGEIFKKVKEGIEKSKLILADFSGGRSDVYFETGLSESMYRTLIFLSRHNKYILPKKEGFEGVFYKTRDIRKFETSLSKAITDVRAKGFLPNLNKGDMHEVPGYCLALVPATSYGAKVYEKIIQPVVEKEGLQIKSVSQIYDKNNAAQRIFLELKKAQFVIVDLGRKKLVGSDSEDPDVSNNDIMEAYWDTLYLTGLAYGLNKEIILMKRIRNEVPHCLKPSTYVSYTGEETTYHQDIANLGRVFRHILDPYHDDRKRIMNNTSPFDIVILTAIKEEFQAVKLQIPSLQRWPGEEDHPNLYSWHTGFINVKGGGYYKVALGLIREPGNTNSALTVEDALKRWSPRYMFFVGVAGGLNGMEKGDVILASVIYGYEYGKLEGEFHPRMHGIHRTDPGLLNGAIVYSLDDKWKQHIPVVPPKPCNTAFETGIIISGEKVVDDPTNEFFAEVLRMSRDIRAVEMEGLGIARAIEQAQAVGKKVGFVVIRGISDVPRPPQEEDIERGTKERDDWKPYASAAAATFTLGYIANGLPVPPKENG